jgi:uncharacterized protein involved in exopolysaccharide biosynthesis
MVLAVVIFGVVAAIGISLLRGPIYSTTMIVKAAEQQGGQGGGALSSALKALPVSLGAFGSLNKSGDLITYLNLFQSREVARLLVNRAHFERELFARSIDADGRWKSSLVRQTKVALAYLFGLEAADRPTAEDVRERLLDRITVNMDELTGLVSITCRSPNIQLCGDFLMAVHRQTEYRLAQMRRDQAQTMIDYVDRQLTAVTEKSSQEALYSARNDAENQRIMASSGVPLGAEIVQPPLLPLAPAFPRPAMMLLVGAALGLVLGILLALFKEYVGFGWGGKEGAGELAAA